MYFNIGIDIGGTHMDAVLVDMRGELKGSVKIRTSTDISAGVHLALGELMKKCPVPLNRISEVKIGTTHATNALLQAKGLLKVGLIRLTGKKAPLIPSAFGWPREIANYLVETVEVEGGFESDGRERFPLDEKSVDRAIERLLKAGAKGIAVASSFSPLYAEHEDRIAQKIPVEIATCTSRSVGGLGFVERENTALLNLLLRDVLKKGFTTLLQVLKSTGIDAPLFLTDNEGSILTLQEALEKPILSLSSGQTNSFIGGAKLLSLQDAVVVDIGGTTTDIGVIRNGFPRKTLDNVDIGGIPVNFAGPDVLSLPVGGGSLIEKGEIGPNSLGTDLFHRGRSFGGLVTTLTDLALRSEELFIEGADPTRVPFSKKEASALHRKAFRLILSAVKKIQLTTDSAPAIVVGGGGLLFKRLFEREGFLVPENGGIANALGAALAETSASLDLIVTQEGKETLEELKRQVLRKAIERGADPETVRLTRCDIFPCLYLGGRKNRVILAAAGKKLSVRPDYE